MTIVGQKGGRLRLSELLWSLSSLAALAIGGLGANVLLARAYGPSDTGLFNQVFALYLIFSQISCFGLQLSALKGASRLLPDDHTSAAEFMGTLLLALSIASSGALALAFLMQPLLILSDRQLLANAWLWAIPGIMFYAFNKIVLGVLNGLQNVRAFALLQAGRPIFFLVCVAVFAALGVPGSRLPLSLSLGEGLLAFIAWFNVVRGMRPRVPHTWKVGVRHHLSFGARSGPGVLLADAGSRADVLVLGAFVTSRDVGIYTVAAWLVEGIQQIAVALRPLVNRQLGEAIRSRDMRALVSLVMRYGGLAAVLTGLGAAVIALAYAPICEFVLRDVGYLDGRAAFVVLAVALTIASFILPFDMFVVQLDKPFVYTALRAAMLIANIAVGVALVPRLGILGAALGYSTSFLLYAAWMSFLMVRFHQRPGHAGG